MFGYKLGRLLHKPKGVPYYVWGGIQALRYAIGRFGSVDVDVHASKDGVLVAVHWMREWRWPDGRKVVGSPASYTYKQLQTMRPRRGGPYRIQAVSELFAEIGNKVVFALEAKPNPLLESVDLWRRVKADADKYGARVVVMTIQRHSSTPELWEAEAVRRLQAAKAAGFPVMVLSRGWLNPDKWGFVDAFKGNAVAERSRGKDLPASVAWVGPGSTVGASAHPSVKIPVLARPRPAPVPATTSTSPSFPAPSPPYIPAAHNSGTGNKPIVRIVMHSTTGSSAAGSARKIADYFQKETARGSAHYVVDAAEEFQCVYDSVIAWHAPPNRHSLGVELCDNPSQDISRWDDADHRAVFARAATLVAQLCLAYNVPIRKLTVAQVRAGERGICGHVDVRDAFRETSHWDPGAFPWTAFIAAVKAEANRIKEAAK